MRFKELPSEGRARAVTSVIQDFWLSTFVGRTANIAKFLMMILHVATNIPIGPLSRVTRMYITSLATLLLACSSLSVPTSVRLSGHWIWRLIIKLFSVSVSARADILSVKLDVVVPDHRYQAMVQYPTSPGRACPLSWVGDLHGC